MFGTLQFFKEILIISGKICTNWLLYPSHNCLLVERDVSCWRARACEERRDGLVSDELEDETDTWEVTRHHMCVIC